MPLFRHVSLVHINYLILDHNETITKLIKYILNIYDNSSE